MPMLYNYSDDMQFIKYYMKSHVMTRNLRKFETLLDEKDKFHIDFIEFFFTDKKIYEQFQLDFEDEDPKTTIFGAFVEHHQQNVFNFRPWFDSKTHALNKPWMYKDLYKMEDYLLRMTYLDETYLNDIFNVSFYNIAEWPKLMKTRIKLSQLKSLFNAYEGDFVENVRFLPSNSGIYRGDTERDHEIQARINAYWANVLKDINHHEFSEMGLSATKGMPVFSYAYGFYIPLLIVGLHFWETFGFHSNLIDPIPPMVGYLVSTFRYIDLGFSTWGYEYRSFFCKSFNGRYYNKRVWYWYYFKLFRSKLSAMNNL